MPTLSVGAGFIEIDEALCEAETERACECAEVEAGVEDEADRVVVATVAIEVTFLAKLPNTAAVEDTADVALAVEVLW